MFTKGYTAEKLWKEQSKMKSLSLACTSLAAKKVHHALTRRWPLFLVSQWTPSSPWLGVVSPKSGDPNCPQSDRVGHCWRQKPDFRGSRCNLHGLTVAKGNRRHHWCKQSSDPPKLQSHASPRPRTFAALCQVSFAFITGLLIRTFELSFGRKPIHYSVHTDFK